jgi:hypothetical protein
LTQSQKNKRKINKQEELSQKKKRNKKECVKVMDFWLRIQPTKKNWGNNNIQTRKKFKLEVKKKEKPV